jgi:hypothetical protein
MQIVKDDVEVSTAMMTVFYSSGRWPCLGRVTRQGVPSKIGRPSLSDVSAAAAHCGAPSTCTAVHNVSTYTVVRRAPSPTFIWMSDR